MENKNVSVQLTVEQWNTVLGALAEIPYRASAEVIHLVRTQVLQSVQPAPQGPLADKVVS